MPRRPAALLAISVLAALALAAPSVAQDATQDEHPQPAWGPVEDSPIRPGASLDGYCTYNWVFYDAVTPTVEEPEPVPAAYIGTAAHCTDELGERVRLPGVGEIGTVVYDADVAGTDTDFSLIEVDEELVGRTNPTMLGWGGPVGYVTPDELTVGDQVDVHGYGLVLGQNNVTRSRYGFLMAWDDEEYVANMPAVWGDSGSPLLHHETGKALGIISRFGFTATPPSTDTGPMMPWILADLEAGGFDVLLAQAQD